MLLDTSRNVCCCILGQRFSLFVRCSLDPATAVFAKTQFSNFPSYSSAVGIIMYWQNGYSKVTRVKRFTFFYPFFRNIGTKLAILNDNKHLVIAIFIIYFELKGSKFLFANDRRNGKMHVATADIAGAYLLVDMKDNVIVKSGRDIVWIV